MKRRIEQFLSGKTSGGIILAFTAIIAMIVANSPASQWYYDLLHNKVGISFNGEKYLYMSIHHWINDGLMAIFFFIVGLELKREIIGGELSSPKKAILPIAAAIGGMVFPALIYMGFNYESDTITGWGIPMATDIAFALMIVYLLGDKIPMSVKIFLLSLAIVDDLGAILVIGMFYTDTIYWNFLIPALGLVFLLFLSNRWGIRSPVYYTIIGIGGVWTLFLLSGIHATLASVLVAFTIPATARIKEWEFKNQINALKDKFLSIDPDNKIPYLKEEQVYILEKIRSLTRSSMPPLQRLEHGMHGLVTFLVLPIFAFANAGITLGEGLSITTQVTLGVMIGLVAGKLIGIVGISIILIKMKIAFLPKGMTLQHIVGVAFLAAIGFTMALFITELAFSDQTHINEAKLGIVIASLISGIVGYLILRIRKKGFTESERGGFSSPLFFYTQKSINTTL